MNKCLTRRQAQTWLAPMRRAFKDMKDGEVDSIDGFAVTRLHAFDTYERVDACIAGFRGLLARLFKNFDSSAMERVETKLSAREPLYESEINDCLSLFNRCENMLVRMGIAEVQDAVVTEQIVHQLEKLEAA